MNLTLSWDLFVIVFVVMVMSYSYIVGRDSALKIIIAASVAILASHGLGNFLEQLAADSTPLFAQIGLPLEGTPWSSLKLILFVLITILLTAHGSLEISYENKHKTATELLLVGVFGFVTATFLLAALITIAADAPLLGGGAAAQVTFVSNPLMNALITYRDIWFSLPAVLLISIGIIRNE